MVICYFGSYSKGEGYPRNLVLIDGLRQSGVSVVECNVPFRYGSNEGISWDIIGNNALKLIAFLVINYVRLFLRFMVCISNFEVDLVLVGYMGHLHVFLAKFLACIIRRPVVFDAFISLYDTLVDDRKLVGKNSVLKQLLIVLDKYACKFADVVLLDTKQHVDYFVRMFNLPRHCFIVVPTGSVEQVFYPRNNTKAGAEKTCKVLFFGTYIPLHGIEYIIKAANNLRSCESIKFELIGSGQLYAEMKAMAEKLSLDNINFTGRMIGYNKLAEKIAAADVCLGIFGTTDKARRVIPCKIYDCLAMGKPIITADTPAIRETLTDGKDVILVPAGDPDALAWTIRRLCSDKKLRESLAKNAYALFKSRFSSRKIAKQLIYDLSIRLGGRGKA